MLDPGAISNHIMNIIRRDLRIQDSQGGEELQLYIYIYMIMTSGQQGNRLLFVTTGLDN